MTLLFFAIQKFELVVTCSCRILMFWWFMSSIIICCWYAKYFICDDLIVYIYSYLIFVLKCYLLTISNWKFRFPSFNAFFANLLIFSLMFLQWIKDILVFLKCELHRQIQNFAELNIYRWYNCAHEKPGVSGSKPMFLFHRLRRYNFFTSVILYLRFSIFYIPLYFNIFPSRIFCK